MEKLKDRVAIITGAGRGIGAATASVLAQNGALVIITDIIPEREEVASKINSLGLTALSFRVDVTDTKEIHQVTQKIIEKFGKIDILVNNAGIYPKQPFNEMKKDDWDNVIDINLNGMFNWSKAVIPTMKAQRYGRIVNLSSTAGAVVGWSGDFVHYVTTKAGILGFTRSVCLALAPYAITVNAVAPGAIDTGAPQKSYSKEEIDGLVSMIPFKRMGRPEEVGNLVAFLASDDASYITGTCIVVDGGYSLV